MSNRVPSTLCLLTMIAVLSAPSAFAQGGSMTRIEQDDPNIVYSGNWYTNDSPNHSGGVAALTNFPGASPGAAENEVSQYLRRQAHRQALHGDPCCVTVCVEVYSWRPIFPLTRS